MPSPSSTIFYHLLPSSSAQPIFQHRNAVVLYKEAEALAQKGRAAGRSRLRR